MTPGHFVQDSAISIHAPREGSDPCPKRRYRNQCKFLSTLPARGATAVVVEAPVRRHISIHAPREGSDGWSFARLCAWRYFYPRSPRGERPVLPLQLGGLPDISIHAPREGSDRGGAAAK